MGFSFATLRGPSVMYRDIIRASGPSEDGPEPAIIFQFGSYYGRKFGAAVTRGIPPTPSCTITSSRVMKNDFLLRISIV